MKILIRAKTINQDFKEETESLKKINENWYAVGFENPCVQKEFQGIKLCAIVGGDLDAHICDYSTRSINFEDMIDSENNKIFASLSEDGKGGDVILLHQFCLELGQNMGVEESEKETEVVCFFTKEGLCFSKDGKWKEPYYAYSGLHEESFKVIGIQE